MGWIDTLKKIGHTAVNVAQVASPLLGLVPGGTVAQAYINKYLPQASALINGVVQVEAIASDSPGKDKLAMVIEGFYASLGTTREIAAANGLTLTVDDAEMHAIVEESLDLHKKLAALVPRAEALVKNAKFVKMANPAPVV